MATTSNDDSDVKEAITDTSSIKQYDTERTFPVVSIVSVKRPPLPPRTSSSSTSTISSNSPLHSPTSKSSHHYHQQHHHSNHSRNNSSNQSYSTTTPSHLGQSITSTGINTSSTSILNGNNRTSLVQLVTPTFPTPNLIVKLPHQTSSSSSSYTSTSTSQQIPTSLNLESEVAGVVVDKKENSKAIDEFLVGTTLTQKQPVPRALNFSNPSTSSSTTTTSNSSTSATPKILISPTTGGSTEFIQAQNDHEFEYDEGIRHTLDTVEEDPTSTILDENDPMKRSRRRFRSERVEDGFGVYWKIIGRERDESSEKAEEGGEEGEEEEKEEEVIAPGFIQSFAVLLVVEVESEGKVKVLQVSENSTHLLSLPPSLLFSTPSFTNYLNPESIENLTEAFETIFEPPSDTEDLFSPNRTTHYSNGPGPDGDGIGSARTHSGRYTEKGRGNRHRTFTLEGFGISSSSQPTSPHFSSSSTTYLNSKEKEKEIRWKVFATLHRPKLDSQICLLELELQDDKLTPLGVEEIEEVELLPIQVPVPVDSSPSLSSTSSSSSSSASSSNTASTSNLESRSQEIPVVVPPKKIASRSLLRKRRKGREEGLDILSLLSRTEERLTGAKELQTFYQVTIDTIAELTRFERIVMKQFDTDGNALVVAEHAPSLPTKFIGLTFPASDFPFPAFDKVNIVYDIAAKSSSMCCRSEEEVNRVVDLRLCSIRGVESSKIRYLNNLALKSTTTLSLKCFNKPWGLISLESSSSVRRPSISSRQILTLLIESINGHLERFAYTRRLNARKFINGGEGVRIGGSNFRKSNGNHKDSSKESRAGLADTGSRGEEEIASGQVMKVENSRLAKVGGGLAALTGMENVANGYIVTKPDDLLLLFDSDFACLSVGEEVQIFGQVENTQDLFGAVEYFRYCGAEVLESSRNISVDFPDLFFPSVAGVLFLPLGEDRLDFLLFFRLAEKSTIKWAGDPSLGTYRTNFTPFESIMDQGKCREWREEELETSLVLCTVYGKFLDVWREKQSALVANQVTALLLSNTSHEVRTPLNHIINNLELALENTTIDDKTRRAIRKSREASLSVQNVVNDLVDLARVPALRLEDSFALASTISDALAGPRAVALRKGLEFEVDENPQGTPLVLLGDRVKLRKILATVAANAVKHTSVGTVRIEYGEVNDEDVVDGEKGKKDGIRIGISVTDTGKGIEDEILTSVFENFEKSSYAHLLNDSTRLLVGDGLDLSVVARIVSSLGGQLQIKSRVGKGSKVTLILPFRLPALGIETDSSQLSDAFESDFIGVSMSREDTETIGGRDGSTVMGGGKGGGGGESVTMTRSNSSQSAIAELLGGISNTTIVGTVSPTTGMSPSRRRRRGVGETGGERMSRGSSQNSL